MERGRGGKETEKKEKPEPSEAVNRINWLMEVRG